MRPSLMKIGRSPRFLLRVVVPLLATVVLAGAGVAATILATPKPIEKIGSSKVEFKNAHAPLALEKADLARRSGKAPWPLWGLAATRTRVAPGGKKLRPPFRVRYVVRGRAMIEYPPVVAYGLFYFGTHAGRFLAARVSDGKIVWDRHLDGCIAASPAVGSGIVYVTSMGPAPCQHRRELTGAVFALNARTGRVRWRVKTGRVESSPLLVDGTLYFASFDEPNRSTVWALDVSRRRPRTRWLFTVPSKVTSSPALLGRRLYIGSYASTLYSLDARTGRLLFAATPPGINDGKSGFYGTPAIAYGRVYIGGLDGRVYAFGARTGALRWVTSTGSYVYSSPAVWRKLVFAGSCTNHRFFAFNAATGRIRWSFQADGRVLGSATVLAGVVYFSTTSSLTYGLDARSGRELWRFPDGQFSPLVVAGNRILLTGKGRVYGLDPVPAKQTGRAPAQRQSRP